MNYDLIFVISLAIYGPASMVGSGYWLFKRTRDKRKAKLINRVRRNMK